MSDVARTLAECSQMIHQLFYYLDESDYAPLVELFDVDGTWHRQGEALTGHSRILESLHRRPSTQRTRHFVTNHFILSEQDGMTETISYMVAYRYDDGTNRQGAMPITRPFRTSLIRTTFRHSGDARRIVEMHMQPEFTFVSEAPAGASQ